MMPDASVCRCRSSAAQLSDRCDVTPIFRCLPLHPRLLPAKHLPRLIFRHIAATPFVTTIIFHHFLIAASARRMRYALRGARRAMLTARRWRCAAARVQRAVHEQALLARQPCRMICAA